MIQVLVLRHHPVTKCMNVIISANHCDIFTIIILLTASICLLRTTLEMVSTRFLTSRKEALAN